MAREQCGDCWGSGKVTCSYCQGEGGYKDDYDIWQQCEQCWGSGKVTCDHCSGTGYVGESDDDSSGW